MIDKMKNKEYHTVKTNPKSNIKIVEKYIEIRCFVSNECFT